MFGDKLKELRKLNNVSQEKLGEFLGVTNTAIYSWEINRTQPPIETIIKLAKFFNVTTDYLLDFNQEDIDKLEKLKTAIKEAGMWDYNLDDMKKEDFEKAIQIMLMLKDTDK